MFRDKDEALARLEEELLEDEPAQETAGEEPEFLEEPDGDTDEYKNFANDYGNVKIYNADTSDLDLTEFSEEVYEPTAKKQPNLLLVAFLLLVGIFLVLAWWAIRYMGVL